MHRSFSTAILLFATLASIASAGENFPCFRGPNSQGIADGVGLPVTWSESKNIVWKIPIHGKAWSSPVIWGSQVWLTTATPDGHELYAVCLDRETGRILLDKKLFDIAQPQYIHPFNSYASPTPVIEDGRVYVTFGSPGTACLDTRTFDVLWQRTDFVCNHFRGAGSSPLLYQDRLIMDFDGSDFQYVVALDKKTGKTLWRTNRSIDFQDIEPDGHVKADGDFRKAFSTPVISTIGGITSIISPGSLADYAYDPLTGRELWRVEYRESFGASVTPIIGNDLIYVTTGFGQSTLLALKTSADSHASIAWKVTRQVPNKPSPLLMDGKIYMITDSGIASARRRRDRKNIWHSRIDGAFSALASLRRSENLPRQRERPNHGHRARRHF